MKTKVVQQVLRIKFDNLTLLSIDTKTKVVQHDNYHNDYYDYHDNYHDDYHNDNHDYLNDYHNDNHDYLDDYHKA